MTRCRPGGEGQPRDASRLCGCPQTYSYQARHLLHLAALHYLLLKYFLQGQQGIECVAGEGTHIRAGHESSSRGAVLSTGEAACDALPGHTQSTDTASLQGEQRRSRSNACLGTLSQAQNACHGDYCCHEAGPAVGAQRALGARADDVLRLPHHRRRHCRAAPAATIVSDISLCL